ncbi:non-ribosomal peptide synthetase [Pedobacter foliorum]|uniref:non-ribosomal peptide synthetase n=1 Tax=Pedobacter foliorum TaxID=2739058 RepID=UPI001564D59A|nr:non-ribosomal peptide synthetase [Pedobacter foliorum]NRF38223.1 amino acid adenylation domain-containing protein [Pedobacter foliorum]
MKKNQRPNINFIEIDFNPFEDSNEIVKTVLINEAQRELWLSCIIGGEPASLAYNESVSLELTGQFDLDCFQKALQEVVNRHEALRSVISPNGEHFIIYNKISFDFGIEDLTKYSSGEQEEILNAFVKKEVNTPFDLEKPPLFKFHLHKLTPDKHYFTLVIHHIIADGWSIGIILEDLSKYYNGYLNGLTATLDSLHQISDYALEEAIFTKGDSFKKTENYWLNLYKEDIPLLDLPTDFPRPIPRSYDANRIDQPLSAELVSQLKSIGAKAGCSFVNTLLSAFEIFLSYKTGKKDVVIGLPSAGQSATEMFNLVGHCVNLMPLRSTVDKSISFNEYLRNRKTAFFDAYEHQQISFGQLIKKLNIKRDPSRIPLIPIMFNIDMGMDSAVSFDNLTHKLISNPRDYETFEIFLNATESQGAFILEWTYNTQLFKASSIKLNLEEFETLLSSLASTPDNTIALSFPQKDSRQLTTNIENDLALTSDKTLTAFIDEIANKYGNKVAISFKDATIDYKSLIEKSNQLASLLAEKGIGIGDVVGLSIDRSLEMIVSLIGILKSGATYLPLDPEYPIERVEFMLNDSSAKVLLTSTAYKERYQTAAREIVIEEIWPLLGNYNKISPKQPDINSLAYILYTSGSTGRPKGVKISHRNLMNFLSSMTNSPGIDFNDRLLAITTISFDIAGLELYLPLICGAEVIIADSEQVKDGRLLLNLMQEKSITIMQATPSSWQMIIDSGWNQKYQLKVLTGGEALPKELATQLLDLSSQVWNMYGPTETTIWSSIKQVQSTDKLITIGAPIRQTQIYILDENLNQLPPLEVGEIYIGGEGVASGYLNRPELTNEKFIADPFSTKTGAKLYGTGDLGKLLENGEFQCLGRIDQQVKIRGHRIELGEIESKISLLDGIKQSVVVAKEDSLTDKRLIAYVVLKEDLSEIDDLSWKERWDTLYNIGAEANKNIDVSEQNLDDTLLEHYHNKSELALQSAEWLQASIDRIKELPYKNIYEIGSGAGQLLFELAPESDRYLATDYAQTAIDKLNEKLQVSPKWKHVKAYTASADDFSFVAGTSFDLVLIHSVAQYFPNADYLIDVLKKSCASVNNKGCIFIGDMQGKSSLEMYHATDHLPRSSDNSTIDQFKNTILNRVRIDDEFVADPAFFYNLPKLIPEIKGVNIQLRKGQLINETTKYHYDIWLYIGESPKEVVPQINILWNSDILTSEIRNILSTNSAGVIEINNILNSRTSKDFALLQLIKTSDSEVLMKDIKYEVSKAPEGIDPNTLWQLGAELNFSTHIRWSKDGTDGCFDVTFISLAYENAIPANPYINKPISDSIYDFAKTPFSKKEITLSEETIEKWKKKLRANLPKFMVPEDFIALKSFPLTPNAKIDRNALPKVNGKKIKKSDDGVLPITKNEQIIAKIWTSVLGIADIKSDDDFFELGGHSILAVKVMVSIEKEIGKRLPIAVLFENSTVKDLAKMIPSAEDPKENELGSKNDLLLSLKNSGQTIVPTTEAQKEIWLACALGGQDANRAYNLSFSQYLNGELNVDAMKFAVSEFVNRHESLRSTFNYNGTEMIINNNQQASWRTLDISTYSTEEQKSYITNFSIENARIIFDLTKDHLFKAVLIKLSDKLHYFTITVHHIVFDGWSFGIAQHELSNLYSSIVSGKKSDLSPAPLFSEYAVQMKDYYKGNEYRNIEQYWLNQLKDDLPTLELPIDFPRPITRTYESNREVFSIDHQAYSGLKKTAIKNNCSLAIILRAAIEILLFRLTGQDDLITGLPMAGQLTQDENLVGHCANVLPLRTIIDENISFSKYLIKRKGEILDAYSHPQLTYGSLLKKLNLGRDQSHPPLVSVVMNTDYRGDDETSFYNLTSKYNPNIKAYENFELALDFTEYSDHMTLRWDYNKALFKPETIFKFHKQFENLANSIANNPDTILYDIPLASEQVSFNKLKTDNNNYFRYDKNQKVYELISEAAIKFPDRTAVSFGVTKLSYSELEEKSNQFANLLIKNGLMPRDKVGVALDRSAEMIIALLAIMKTGAIYLPFDTNHPKERIAYMLDDAGANFLITEQKYAKQYSTTISEIYLKSALKDLSQYSTDKPGVVVSGDDLIYILHTSGSTGKPKGVQIRHRNVVNFLLGMQQTPGIKTEDVLLAITPISFDMAVLLYLPLTCGAEVVIADLESSKDGRLIYDIIKNKQITWMIATPSTWKMTIAAGWTQKLQMLAISAGESLSKDLAEKLITRCSSVWNGYGPTETAVMVLMKEITDLNEPITLGKPIINTQIYLLNKNGRRVNEDSQGEIYIAGDSVGAGYHNLPDMTSNQFITNPFSCDPENTMYRTGDLGKLMPNGDIQYLGRIDQQIKIRGHRIELEEIEQTLILHPNVKSAIVNPFGNSPENMMLVAYIIPEQNQEKSNSHLITEWESYLKNLLPDYMIPKEYVFTDSYPLTENGKIDRKKLPKPEIMNIDNSSESYLAPRNSTEELVANIWANALEIDKISIKSDFFKSGGHSLTAVDIMLLIEKETGKRLPLSSLFENPTVEKFAKLINGNEKDIKWNSLVEIKKSGTRTPIYMIHGSGLNILVFNSLAKHMDKDQPLYGMQALGLNGDQKLLYTMEELADYYNAEILNNDPVGPYILAGYSFGGVLAYEMARKLLKMGKEIKMLGIMDTYVGSRSLNMTSVGKLYKKTLRQFNKLLFFSKQFTTNPTEVYNYQSVVIKDKVQNLIGMEVKDDNEAFSYHKEVNKSYDIAYENYVMEPLDIQVDLFRVKKRIYFLDDPVYLGWNKFAKKGVNIHEVPGDHKTFLFPPNDKEFAEIFENALKNK